MKKNCFVNLNRIKYTINNKRHFKNSRNCIIKTTDLNKNMNSSLLVSGINDYSKNLYFSFQTPSSNFSSQLHNLLFNSFKSSLSSSPNDV